MTSREPSVDAQWVRSIVDQYEGPLILYAARIVGDVETARDVAQETFLRLCRQDQAKVAPRVAEWLYTVCRNRAVDIVRKEKRMNPLTDKQAATQESRDPAPPDVLERKESESQVVTAVGTLPENQQEVIRLKFQHGLSYREISRVTELSESNVGFLLHTGLKALRQTLGLSGAH